MLFNTYFFIIVFLPVVLLGYHIIGKVSHQRITISWLVAASLFFYAWWNPAYLGLIVASIIFNYRLGVYIKGTPSKNVLGFGIFVNLAALCYFKYANFLVDNFNSVFEQGIRIDNILLPLAISFFTFQQVAYLVDAYRGIIKEYNFLQYCLFVTFFPQLISGPIVHHKDMLPQFSNNLIYELKGSNLAIGVTIFVLGLFKKVVLADSIAIHSSPIFSAAESGEVLSFYTAWFGAIAYSFQLYFDFSGYSDMAVGAARMFGIILPINFFSPYKSRNIIEFWRRWHITLSSFLRDYLYIPLGGSRKGIASRHLNLLVTMLLGGLWHGAGWTFIIWGGIHGVLLTINHAWKQFVGAGFPNSFKGFEFSLGILGCLVTFTCVVFAWVMFRVESVDGAINIYSSMLGFNGVYVPSLAEINEGGLRVVVHNMFQMEDIRQSLLLMFLMFFIVWFMPNTFELVSNCNPVLGLDNFNNSRTSRFKWKFTPLFACLLALLSFTCLVMMATPSEFLYFQF